MGAALLYGERQQVIPVVNQLSGLEYQIARAIKRLIDPEPDIVGYSIGHGEVEPFYGYPWPDSGFAQPVGGKQHAVSAGRFGWPRWTN